MTHTNKSLLDAWRVGNNAGRGYAIGEDTDSPMEACRREEDVIATQIDPEGACTYIDDDGRVIVVADANGPWAVDVTDMIRD